MTANISYTIYDSDGSIIQVANGLTEEDIILNTSNLNPGLYVILEDSDINSDKIDPITKKVIKGGKPKPVPTYAETRQNAYPTVQEQLDMLWHAMNTNQLPKAEPFYSVIKTVKDSYPKDNSAAKGSTKVVTL